jgi:hypothetical protein
MRATVAWIVLIVSIAGCAGQTGVPSVVTSVEVQSAKVKEKEIDADSFIFRAPIDDSWKIEIEAKGIVNIFKQAKSPFGSKLPLTSIRVVENRAMQERWNFTEEEVADEVRMNEEAGMMTLGGLQGEYYVSDVKKDTINVDGKRIYMMSYRNSGGKLFGKDKIMEAVLYLYFPPDFRESHKFYQIIIAEIHAINKQKETDFFTLAYPIINNLRSK